MMKTSKAIALVSSFKCHFWLWVTSQPHSLHGKMPMGSRWGGLENAGVSFRAQGHGEKKVFHLSPPPTLTPPSRLLIGSMNHQLKWGSRSLSPQFCYLLVSLQSP